jgi:hypothetical protein
MRCLAKSVLVVGLAAISVFAHLSSGGAIGFGWGALAVFVLFFADCGR